MLSGKLAYEFLSNAYKSYKSVSNILKVNVDDVQNKLKSQREKINATYSWDKRSFEWKNFFNKARKLKI